MMECSVCHERSFSMKRCSRCHITLYCSSHCQKLNWPAHRLACTAQQETNTSAGPYKITYYNHHGREIHESLNINVDDADTSVNIMCRGRKSTVVLSKLWTGNTIMKLISRQTRVSMDEMKVIIKGKVMDSNAINDYIIAKTTIMVIGNEVHSSEGLDERDIECLMTQLNLNRNSAIERLRKSSTLLDAMLDI